MFYKKWLKLGVAAFLSVGMLTACGNEEPADEETPEEENGDTVVPGKDDPEVINDPDSEGEDGNETEESDKDDGEDNIDAEDTEVGDED